MKHCKLVQVLLLASMFFHISLLGIATLHSIDLTDEDAADKS